MKKAKILDPKGKLAKAFLRTARYSTPFCDQWGKFVITAEVLKEIPERFRHSSWTEEMAVEVVKEMTDEYEYWQGTHGTHVVMVKPGWWEGIDYTSKEHDPILRACQVAMAEHCPMTTTSWS
jgi:hypothetical protein